MDPIATQLVQAAIAIVRDYNRGFTTEPEVYAELIEAFTRWMQVQESK